MLLAKSLEMGQPALALAAAVSKASLVAPGTLAVVVRAILVTEKPSPTLARVTAALVSIFAGVFHQLCPRCRIGSIFRSSIFRGYPSMRERCPVCQLKFEREQGYFLGAMYISYGLALLIRMCCKNSRADCYA